MNGSFLHQSSAFGPLTYEQQPMPEFGLPSVGMGGNPLMGLAAQLFLSSFLQKQLGQAGPFGMVPGGFHDQNVYDTWRNMQFTQMQSDMMNRAAKLNESRVIRMAEGFNRLAGGAFTEDKRQAAQQLASTISANHLLFSTFAPGFLDTMGLTAPQLAGQVALTSRRMVDPITGHTGLSMDSANAIVDRLSRFVNSPENIYNFSHRQVGQLFSGLHHRGLLPGAALPPELVGKTAEELDRLTADPRVQQRIRSFNAQRTLDTIKDWSKAVRAMEDIFTASGRPDAPIEELLNGLEALTQGASTSLGADRAAKIARTSQVLQQVTGVSIDTYMGLQQHMGVIAQRLGVAPELVPALTQEMVTGNLALRQVGLTPTWGLSSVTKLTQQHGNLLAGASASRLNNAFGALLRVRRGAGGFAAGSEAERIAQALMSGDASALEGITEADVLGALRAARGANGEALDINVQQVLRQRAANQETMLDYGTHRVTRRLQSGEVRQHAARAIRNALGSQLAAQGFDQRQQQAIAERVARELLDMDDATFADVSARNAAISSVLEQVTGGRISGGATAEQVYGAVDQAFRDRQGRSLADVRALHGKAFLDQQDRVALEVQAERELSDALAPLKTRGGLMRRVVAALADPSGKGAQDLKELLGKAIGGVGLDEIAKAVGGQAEELHQLQQEYTDLLDQRRKATTPEERKAIDEKLNRLRGDIGARAAALHRVFKETKFGEGVTLEEVEQAIPLEKLKELSEKASEGKKDGGGDTTGTGDVAGLIGGQRLEIHLTSGEITITDAGRGKIAGKGHADV